MRLVFAAILFLVPVTASASEDFRQMSGSEIETVFSGKTAEGFYIRKNVLSGTQDYVETYHADGTLSYQQGEFTDTGIWEIQTDELCHEYDYDAPGTQHCFHIYQRQNCYYFFSAELKRYNIPPNDFNWNNRNIIRGESLTCDLLVS